MGRPGAGRAPRERGRERGARLTQLRQFFRLNQEELGNWLGGYSQANVSQWETGLRPMPYADVARRFGVSVDWLMNLSPVMWGYRINQLQRAVKEYLTGLTPAEQEQIRKPTTDPADRIRMLVKVCQERLPELIDLPYLAGIMHLEIDTLQEIVSGETYAEYEAYSRFAQFLDLPVGWFEFGDTKGLSDQRLEEYRGSVAEAIARGISPERLIQILTVVAPVKQDPIENKALRP